MRQVGSPHGDRLALRGYPPGVFPKGSTARQQLDELQAIFGFDYDGQDWGVVNADRTRVAEFADFFVAHHDANWSEWTVAEFVDLVLESASDALRADANFPLQSLDRFLALAAPRASDSIVYWTSHDWPVTPHLRSLGLP